MTRRIKHVSAVVFLLAALVATGMRPVRADDCSVLSYACDAVYVFPRIGLACNGAVTCGDIEACAGWYNCGVEFCQETGSYPYGGPYAVVWC